MSEDLQIRLKVEEMIQYAYAPLRNFPKSEKHGEALPAISKYLQDHPFRRQT